MKYIGLLMCADEDDILERTLAHNAEFVDCFYALDGTADSGAAGICLSNPKCASYTRDVDVLYKGPPRDGWRQVLLEKAYADHGHDNWFVLLHGDELWETHPAENVGRFDAYTYRLPFYFPRAGEEWQDDVHPLDQLRWSLGPGWPEFRMFRGGRHVQYDPDQHFDVLPRGIRSHGTTFAEILHYPYRSPAVQRARAARHTETGFDPDNFAHINDGDNVYWTDEMIAAYRKRPEFRDLRCPVAA